MNKFLPGFFKRRLFRTSMRRDGGAQHRSLVQFSPVDKFAAPVYNQVHQFLLMTERIEKLCEAAEMAVGSLPPLDEIFFCLPSGRWSPCLGSKRKGRTCEMVRTGYEMAAFGRRFGILQTFFGCVGCESCVTGSRMRFMRICTNTLHCGYPSLRSAACSSFGWP